MTTLSDYGSPSDLLLRLIDRDYSVVTVTIANSSGSTVTAPFGNPVTLAGVLVGYAAIATEDSTLKGLLLDRVVIPDGESRKVAALVRGPAIIREGALPTEDHLGHAYDMTKLKSEIAKLSPLIVVQAELANVSTQTT